MKIIIMYATAGHGHKKAAEYMFDEIQLRKKAGAAIDVSQVDMFDTMKQHFVKVYAGGYEYVVSHMSWLWAFGYWLTNIKMLAPFWRPIRRVYNKINSCALEKFLIEENPDILLSAHFFPPEVATSLRRRGKITSKIVSLVTDCIPHFTWINPGTDAYLVMSQSSKDELIAWGVEAERVQVTGIPVSNRFVQEGSKDAMRHVLGLGENRLTILLTSGSFGIGPIEEILGKLAQFKEHVQALVVCGTNEALKETLSQETFEYPVSVYGFVDNMHELMHASDIIVAKTGGLTTTESLTVKVPLVISKPIPGQEAGNAEYLKKHGCAFSIRKPDDIIGIVQSILDNPAIIHEKIKNIESVRKPQATQDIIDAVLRLGEGKA